MNQTIAVDSREAEALNRLNSAKLRLRAADAATGKFRLDFLNCPVFKREELQAQQFAVERERDKAGAEFQAALKGWVAVKR